MTLTVLPAGVRHKKKSVGVSKKSLRIRASASAYLNRTPATATNRKTWTWSGWIKRGKLGSVNPIFIASDFAGTGSVIQFNATDSLQFILNAPTVTYWNLVTNQVFRDPSAWYHIVVTVDTANATSSNRILFYVNGTKVTSFSTSTYPPLNDNGHFGSTLPHYFGRDNTGSIVSADLYITEVNFIDGQALDPTSFGETDPITGEWRQKKYTGTYGTNGFRLNFEDTTSLATIGHDSSGNNNHWTTNNISLSGNATYDSMNDVPEPIDAATGNYCVWNPLDKDSSVTVSDGNLSASFLGASDFHKIRGSMSFPKSSKTYFEITVGSSVRGWVGIGNNTMPLSATGATSYGINEAGQYYVNGSPTGAIFSGFTAGNVIGFAVDTIANTITFYKNGIAETAGAKPITPDLTYFPVALFYSAIFLLNCGQRPFVYAPPAGFLALNTYNIPNGTVTMTGTFTGNASADGSFVWLNGTPTAMTINGNAVAWGTHADKLANGFKVRTAAATHNHAGSNTYVVTTAGNVFKEQLAQTNP